MLAETGWPAASLQVELTESDAMDGATSLSTLRAIAAMGVRIAIDDFGTGYSNLAYLRRLPVQTLKLAAPFVSGPNGDDVDVEIAAALIRLGHSLGMTVVAEAIEKAEQCAQLRDLGCDIGQGYYFSPPLPAEPAVRRAAARRVLESRGLTEPAPPRARPPSPALVPRLPSPALPCAPLPSPTGSPALLPSLPSLPLPPLCAPQNPPSPPLARHPDPSSHLPL